MYDSIPIPRGIIDFSGEGCYFEDGTPLTTMTVPNTIVDGGRRLILELLYGSYQSGVSDLTFYTVGSGIGATSLTMYKPQAEHTDGWTDFSATRTRSDKTNMFTLSAPSGKYTGKWGEICTFNKSGIMFSRSVFPLFTKPGDASMVARQRWII